jgi:hypothetical protein
LASADTDFMPLQSFVNDDPNAVYWLKFKLYQKNNFSEKWILEILDSRHYSVELYTINYDGSYFAQASGIHYPFSKREYLHKNFVFDLRLQEKYPTEFYLKFTPKTIGSFIKGIKRLHVDAQNADTMNRPPHLHSFINVNFL